MRRNHLDVLWAWALLLGYGDVDTGFGFGVGVWVVVALFGRVVVDAADFDDGEGGPGVAGGGRVVAVSASVAVEGVVGVAADVLAPGADAFCSALRLGQVLGDEKGERRRDLPLMIWRNVKTVRDMRRRGTSWPKVDGSFSGFRVPLSAILGLSELCSASQE